jgi:hypothetical protein
VTQVVTQVESQVESHAQTLTQHGFQAFFEFSRKKMSHKLSYAPNPYTAGVLGIFKTCDSCTLKNRPKNRRCNFFNFSYSLRLDEAPTKKQKITLPLFLKKVKIHESQKQEHTPQPMWNKGFGCTSTCDSSFFEKIQKMPETRAV